MLLRQSPSDWCASHAVTPQTLVFNCLAPTRVGTRVASFPAVGSSMRFLLLPLVFTCVAALSLGSQDANAGRNAPTRSKATTSKATSKLQVQKRASSARHRPSSRATSLRSKHGLRLKSNTSNLHQKRKASKKSQLASKSQQVRGAKARRISASRTKPQRKTKRARAQSPTKDKSNAKPGAGPIARTFARVKALPAVQAVARRFTRLSAATTRGLDRLQARAPPWLATTMKNLRTYSVVSLAAFNLSYIKRDAKFLGTYFAATAVVSYAVLPGAIAFGLHPVTSTILNALTTPLAAAVLVFRDAQLKRRAGQPTTLAESGRSILMDYKRFANTRQAAASARAAALSPLK